MKTFLSFVAVCFTAAVLGCQSTDTVSPGALGSECGAKCSGQACTKDKSECCGAKKCDGASMGAVSECGAKTECHHNKSECSKACSSMGAVSDKAECGAKSECKKVCPATGAAGTECTKDADASLGAIGEKRQCGTKKSRCGAL